MTVDIDAAQDPKTGQWYRGPIDNLPPNQPSTISRDMVLGLLWYCWRQKRLDLLEQFWDYCKKNHWVIGQGDASRICLLPGLQGTLALLIARMGGTKHLARYNPQSWPSGQVGFEAHLEVLHILLRGEAEGMVDASCLAVLNEQAVRQPNNPLFAAALMRYTGQIGKADSSLLNTKWWPDDRLPRQDDRSEPWLPQRDYGSDWLPGNGTKQWSGGDLLFCASV